jgi:hypothetical protein
MPGLADVKYKLMNRNTQDRTSFFSCEVPTGNLEPKVESTLCYEGLQKKRSGRTQTDLRGTHSAGRAAKRRVVCQHVIEENGGKWTED